MKGYYVSYSVDVTYSDVITKFIPVEDYCKSYVDSVMEEEIEDRLKYLPDEIDGFSLMDVDFKEM